MRTSVRRYSLQSFPSQSRASTLDRGAYEPEQFARIPQVFRCDLEHSIAHLRQEILAGFWMSSALPLAEIDDYARFSAEIIHNERANTALPNERVTSKRLASK